MLSNKTQWKPTKYDTSEIAGILVLKREVKQQSEILEQPTVDSLLSFTFTATRLPILCTSCNIT